MAEKRTTIIIEETLLKEAKREALENDKSLKEVIEEALRIRLNKEKPLKKKVEFKAYHLGEMKGTARREEIYDWL